MRSTTDRRSSRGRYSDSHSRQPERGPVTACCGFSCPACGWRIKHIHWARQQERTVETGSGGKSRLSWRSSEILKTDPSMNAGNGRLHCYWIPSCAISCRSGGTAARGNTIGCGRKDELESLCQGKSFPKPNPEQFDAYLDDLLNFDPAGLGRRPPGLTKLITDAALGSPAILASRCLKMLGVDDTVRRRLATGMAEAFWHLFNQPAVISLINQLPAAAKTSTSGAPYWHRVLRYCQQGNLQAGSRRTVALALGTEHLVPRGRSAKDRGPLRKAIRPGGAPYPCPACMRASSDPNMTTPSRPKKCVSVRSSHLRFGHLPTEDGQNLSQDAVQAAFNSPFRPFVLTSTSIGQEGLDFHPWCHRLMHWDLPGNPVDLEQREGRVHRYKGHAVRRNVAAAHGQIALSDWSPGTDLWARMFEIADETARAKGESDLVPHWIAPGNCRVQRHVPLLPYTREVEVFQWLKRQLAAYRVVIGQPRQEELVTLLDQAEIDVGQLAAWTVDLSPPRPISNTSNPRKW